MDCPLVSNGIFTKKGWIPFEEERFCKEFIRN